MVTDSNKIFNVPNQLTFARFVLAIVVFVLLPFGHYLSCLILFTIAASTDWVDGYWARKYDQVTKLGRVFDPFVDKVIICGTFILLAADQHQQNFVAAQIGIAGWMAVVVMGREILVTAIRSHIEQAGGDFSARWSGKWKMVFQCMAAILALLAMHLTSGAENPIEELPHWLFWSLGIFVWLAVATTVYSGAEYVRAAITLFRADSGSELQLVPAGPAGHWLFP